MDIWGKVRQNKILFVGLLIFGIAHLYFINAPPNGYHRWRESDTAAVILNYFQEDMSFLEPRINQRGDTSGITGMELPIYNYSAALLYKLIGPYHFLARFLTLLAAFSAIGFLYSIVGHFSGKQPARLACWALAFSPLFFFYSYKIMPDIWMLMFFLGAIRFFLLYLENNSHWYWGASAILLATSAAMKPLGLGIYLPFLYLILKDKKQSKGRLPVFGIFMCISFLPSVLWLYYARWLQAKHGVGAFYLGGYGLTDFLKYFFDIQFLKKLVLQWPFELWIGWAIVPIFFAGIYYTRRKSERTFYLLWIVGMYIVFILTAVKSSTHDYYTLTIVPALAAISGVGMYGLLQRGGWRKILLTALLVISPAVTIIRIVPRFGDTGEFHAIRMAAERAIPVKSLVMVEDKTQAIRLYQLNRKGWPLKKNITYREIKEYVGKGGQFLILDKPIGNYDDSLRLIFSDSAIKLGSLYCYNVDTMIDRREMIKSK